MTQIEGELTMLLIDAFAAENLRGARKGAIGKRFDVLDQWVLEVVPADIQIGVREALASTNGSPLEPFTLTPLGLTVSERLVGVCLALGESRCRVVGESTPTADGGLVVTNKLRAIQLHRYPLGRPRHSPASRGWVAPRLFRERRKDFMRAGSATQTLSAKGLRIAMPLTLRELAIGGISAKLVGTRTDVRTLDWDLKVARDQAVLASSSPEGTLKMLTACARSELIEIEIQGVAANSYAPPPWEMRGLVRLSPIEEEGTTNILSVLGMSPHATESCLGVPPLVGPARLTQAQRQSLARAYVLPRPLVNDWVKV